MYICIHICTYVYIYVHLQADKPNTARACVCMHVYKTCIHTKSSMIVHSMCNKDYSYCIHTCMHKYMCVYIYTHTQFYTSLVLQASTSTICRHFCVYIYVWHHLWWCNVAVNWLNKRSFYIYIYIYIYIYMRVCVCIKPLANINFIL